MENKFEKKIFESGKEETLDNILGKEVDKIFDEDVTIDKKELTKQIEQRIDEMEHALRITLRCPRITIDGSGVHFEEDLLPYVDFHANNGANASTTAMAIIFLESWIENEKKNPTLSLAYNIAKSLGKFSGNGMKIYEEDEEEGEDND